MYTVQCTLYTVYSLHCTNYIVQESTTEQHVNTFRFQRRKVVIISCCCSLVHYYIFIFMKERVLEKRRYATIYLSHFNEVFIYPLFSTCIRNNYTVYIIIYLVTYVQRNSFTDIYIKDI